MAYSKHCNDLAIRLSQLIMAEKAIVYDIPMGCEYGHLLASIKAERRDVGQRLIATAKADLDKPEEGEKDETDYSSYINPDR